MNTDEYVAEADTPGKIGAVDDSLVEELWHELDGRVSHEQIRRLVTEIAAEYRDAAVQAFVPIFVHRKVLDQMKEAPGHS
jgi:hypothetical protein